MRQFMHSFMGFTPPPEILDAVRRGTISSFCLFAHQNVQSPAQLRELTNALQQAAREGGQPPLIIGADQEGGQLIAIRGGATELPGNMALGATRSEELAEQAGRVLGRELLAMGVNMNFAPSLDVNSNPENPAIGIRSFGDDPVLVARLGVAMIRGMQAEGVIATAKHFPGHGDTRVDSHNTVPVIAHPIERMNSVELLPFRAAIEADVKAVLSAHIIFEALDGEHPATISRRIMDGLLRSEMGFDGLIITDAMDMYAVAREGTTESLSGALKAGVDLVMLGHIDDQLNLNRQFQGQESIEALARILDVAQKLPRALPPLAVVGCKEHQDIAQTIANRSITMVSDNGRLPLRLSPDDELAVVSVSPADLTPADTSALVKIELADAVKKRHVRVSAHELPYRASAADIHRLVEATETAKQIVVGTINASHDPSQAAFVRALVDRGQQPVVVALRTPYDITAFPMVQTYLCAYSIRHVSTEAAAKVLFGEIEAQGVLPCAIPKAAL